MYIINIIVLLFLNFFIFPGDLTPKNKSAFTETKIQEVEDKIYYVHNKPDRGKGTLESPWNMKQAHEEFIAMIKGGDRLKHLPGVYIGKWRSLLNGKPERPIICEPADYNDPPVFMSDFNKSIKEVEGQTFHILGSQTWYVNFTFRDEYEKRISDVDWYKDDFSMRDVKTHDMVYISGGSRESVGVRLINCMVYDVNGIGVFLSEKAHNAEIYGNLIAFNGFEGGDRGHGPGTYMRSQDGALIENNIIFANHQLGLRIYGHAIGFKILDNVSFSNGVISEKNKADANLFIGGSGNSKIIDKIYSEGNICYHAPFTKAAGTRIGYRGVIKHVDLVNEHYIAPNPIQVDKLFPPQLAEDLTSKNITYEISDKIKITKNKYEINSAVVTVLNKSGNDVATIDLKGIVEKGTKIAIWDIQNFKGKPVWEQEYKGQKIALPLNLNEVSQPFGNVSRSYTRTPKEFNCFIIRAVDRNNTLIINRNIN
ncbi:MAG: right-handed parallel beta-helix repeat-containing protein [Bacteroidota bacterium]|nr:right-handed parallel beta-helix repeat-containing protein [Bacteroidota bacterium]